MLTSKRYTTAIAHSHLLIAPNYSSLNLYLDSSEDDYPQNIWKTQENFLFLILCNETNSDINYHDMLDGFWNEKGIMNIHILIKSLKKLQAQYFGLRTLYFGRNTS